MLLNHHERNGREDIGDEFDDQPAALFEAAIAVNIRQQTVVQEALADRASSMSSTLRRGLASDHIRWLATGKDARKDTLKATLSWLKHKEVELRAQKLSFLMQDEPEVQRFSNLGHDHGAYPTKAAAGENGDRNYSALFLKRQREREERLSASSYFSSPTARSAAATALALSEAQRYAALALEEHSPNAFSKAAPVGPSPGIGAFDTGSRRIGGRRRRLFSQGGYFKTHPSEPDKTGHNESSSPTEAAKVAATGATRSADGRVETKERTGVGGTGGGGSGDDQEKAPRSGTPGEGRYPINIQNLPPVRGVGVGGVSYRPLEKDGMVAAVEWPPTAAETRTRTGRMNTGNAQSRRGESLTRKIPWRAMFLCWADCGDASYGEGSDGRGFGYSARARRPSERVVMRGRNQRAKSWRADGSYASSDGSGWSAESWPTRPGGLEQGAFDALNKSGSADVGSGRSSRSSGTSGLSGSSGTSGISGSSGSSGRSTGSKSTRGDHTHEIPPFKPKPSPCATLALAPGSFAASEAGKSNGSRGSADRTLDAPALALVPAPAPAPASVPAGADCCVSDGGIKLVGQRSRPSWADVSAAGQTEEQTKMLDAVKSYRGRRGRGGRGARGVARAGGDDEQPLLGRDTEARAEKGATTLLSIPFPRSLMTASSAVSSVTVPSEMPGTPTWSSAYSPSVAAPEEELTVASTAGRESGGTSGAKGFAVAAASAAAPWQASGSFLGSPDSAAASAFSADSDKIASTNRIEETRPARDGRGSGLTGDGANHDADGRVEPPAEGETERATEPGVVRTTPAALAAALAAAMASAAGFESSGSL